MTNFRTCGIAAGFVALAFLAGCASEVDAASAEPLGEITANPLKEGATSSSELARMNEHVRERNSGMDVRHVFQAAGGEIVDCVTYETQPGYRHVGKGAGRAPAMQPSLTAATGDGTTTPLVGADAAGRARSCPTGTVPIRRLTVEEVARAKDVATFRSKYPKAGDAGPESLSVDGVPPAVIGHEYAGYRQYVDNWGAETRVNIWSPYVELSSEFSLSQLWVARGSGSTLETVEAGIQVYRQKYGDSKGRFFIYFTPDNYGSGGCYNTDCSAWVQYSTSIYPGAAFTTYSTTGGAQYDWAMRYRFCPESECGSSAGWWLGVTIGTASQWVGYYPRSLFDSNGLQNLSARLTFGGEIYANQTARHTATDMGGGGYFASSGFGYAAFQRNIAYITTSNVFASLTLPTSITSNSNCYNAAKSTDPNWGLYFYYGGPGYNTNCN